MRPILFHIPGTDIPFYSYGFILAAAILIAVAVITRFGKRQGLGSNFGVHAAIIIFIGGIGGAKLLQLLVDTVAYDKNLSVALRSSTFLSGGGVFFGGMLTVLLAMLLYFRLRGLRWWYNVDLILLAMPLGHAVGRLACFLSGCCWGKPSNLLWAVRFPPEANLLAGTPYGVSLHPVQIYSSLGNLAIFGILLLMFLKYRKFPGQIALSYFLAYGTFRFLIEFLRDDPRGVLPLGLSTSQGISLLLVLGACCAWPFLRRRPLPDSPFLRQKSG